MANKASFKVFKYYAYACSSVTTNFLPLIKTKSIDTSRRRFCVDFEKAFDNFCHRL